MNTITVDHYYSCSASDVVQLPEGKTIEDIESCYVKWGRLNIHWKGSVRIDCDFVVELISDTTDSIDWKRPSSVEIFANDEDDCRDYSRGDYAEKLNA